MPNKNLATAAQVQTMLRTNSVFVEIDGSIRRISLDNLMSSINEGNEQLLRQVAWGVPIKDTIQSSPVWGRVGNLDMWEEYKSLSGSVPSTVESLPMVLHSMNLLAMSWSMLQGCISL